MAAQHQNIAFEVRKPPLGLAPFVHSVSAYVEHTDAKPDELETPTASLMPMIILLGAGWDYTIRGHRHSFGESFFAGLCTTPITMHSRGYAACMQVNFTPSGARRFLRMDMHELLDNLVPLEIALGRAGLALHDRLLQLNSWNDRFEYLYKVLVDRVLCKPGFQAASHTVDGALTLLDNKRCTTVNDMTSELGVSRKHLTSLFRREVGLSPGKFLQLRRFEQALAVVKARPEMPLAEVAHGAGFADQAHFSREFSRFMDQTPSNYLRHTAGGDR